MIIMKPQILLILLFALIVTSCNNRFDTAPAQRELNNNRNLWNSQGIENYSYVLDDNNVGCQVYSFWCIDKRIQVSNNKICLITLDEDSYRGSARFGKVGEEIFLISNTLEVKPDHFDSFFTIDQWFDRIQDNIDAINEQQSEITFATKHFVNSSDVNVVYNQEYGCPVSILLAVADSFGESAGFLY